MALVASAKSRSCSFQCRLCKLWIYVAVIFVLVHKNCSIKWLGISRYTRPESLELERFSPLECRFNNLNHGLQKRQTKFCLSIQHSHAMHGILRASKAAVFYCMKTFQDHRWNCSSAERLPYIGKDLESGTQEQAVVHAFSSTALLYEISRRCAQNKISHCSCGSSNSYNKPDITQEKLMFAGCPDNTDVGLEYVRRFTGYHKLGRRKKGGSKTSVRNKLKNIQRLNGHNYEAGLMILLDNQRTHCKCHGVSGSCNQRICYRQLRRLDDEILLTILKKKYLTAKYVEISGNSVVVVDPFGSSDEKPKPISPTDLAFIEHSPDFCEPDHNTGSLGTHGRICKTDNVSRTATDHCTNMCCGRGYRMVFEQKLTKCNCRINDQFKIQCEDCFSNVKTYYCL